MKSVDYTEAERLYREEKMPDRGIARAIGCSDMSIWNWRRMNKLPPNKTRFRKAPKEKDSTPPPPALFQHDIDFPTLRRYLIGLGASGGLYKKAG